MEEIRMYYISSSFLLITDGFKSFTSAVILSMR